jgi:hypothetical protein
MNYLALSNNVNDPELGGETDKNQKYGYLMFMIYILTGFNI